MTEKGAEFATEVDVFIKLLKYPNPEGLHCNEVRLRNIAREIIDRHKKELEGFRERAAKIAEKRYHCIKDHGCQRGSEISKEIRAMRLEG